MKDKLYFAGENYEGPSHASCLGGYVQEAIDMAKHYGFKLDAVAVSCGPGVLYRTQNRSIYGKRSLFRVGNTVDRYKYS